MTGFASKNIPLPIDGATQTAMVVSLKSLNARFFEVTCKLPYQFNHLEVDLIRLIQQKLQRGHIYFTVYLANPDAFKGTVNPSLTVVDGYMAAIKMIQQKYQLSDAVTIGQILQLPNVFTFDEKRPDENLKKYVVEATEQLIDAVIEQQGKEGEALKADIEKRIDHMQQDMQTIEASSGILIENQKNKIAKVLQDIAVEGVAPTADIQKHAAFALLDKMDINEEIVRFKSHLGNLRSELGSKTQEKGKRLDFTLQELAREINTIAAKCSDASIGNVAINIKVELEKAREQAQNIV
jgi:uncharacterized protein (TIGR00255 family)